MRGSTQEVIIRTDGVELEGSFSVPDRARGVVLFAHGSGSSRRSPRNVYVSRVLYEAGLATVLFDLLTAKEAEEDEERRGLRFDIGFLAGRLVGATDWLSQVAAALPIGYFGASTGAAAALVAASHRPAVGALVSRGGRPDLAGRVLSLVKAPTLLIVGGQDSQVLALNQQAFATLTAKKELAIIPGATHLFEEPGALEEAARLAADWFLSYLSPAAPPGVSR